MSNREDTSKHTSNAKNLKSENLGQILVTKVPVLGNSCNFCTKNSHNTVFQIQGKSLSLRAC